MDQGSANAREVATGIVRTLREKGHVAYFAGGCVRDELLGLTPSDYDVATDARPETITALFPRTAQVGAAFGVVLVRHRGVSVEVATFRSDGQYTDKRRPDVVTFADEIADARRRDFTMNALFLDPLRAPDDPSRIIDHVGGVKDLHAKVLRAVGDADKRLAEDHLRALRAVRLATRLELALERGTAEAIRRHASELRGVSRERIGDEVRLMLTHKSRAVALDLLTDLALDVPALGRPHQSPHAADRYAHLRGLVLNGSGPVFAAALAATLLDREGESLVAETARSEGLRLEVVRVTRASLCLSNDERDDCLAILRALALLGGSWKSLGVAAQKRAAAGNGFSWALEIVEAVRKAQAEQVRARVRELSGTAGGLSPIPFVTGDDLVEAGFKPGPGFRKILDSIYDAQLEGRVSSAEGAMAMARELGGAPGV